MKRIVFICLPHLSLIVLFFASCKKTDTPSYNTPFFANAGKDITLLLPLNRLYLNIPDGYYFTGKTSFNWKKIGGPDSFSINYPNFVYNLVKGVYQFQLTVTNWNQLTAQDTMTITVLPDNNIYTSEKVFENVHLIDNYPNLFFNITDISSIIPSGHLMKVYVKPSLNDEWEIVAPVSQWAYEYRYNYSINNNIMKVFHNYDPTGCDGPYEGVIPNSSIKIMY